jgi:alkylation response protein AidB-like acyl-CoA dehydrogenase
VRFTPQDEQFRAEVRAWLAANLTGEFAALRGAGGPGREHERHDERLAWNRHLAAAGWTCLGWPAEFGGRGATLAQQVIFHEEYARAETIYGGSDEIQRNIIATRALGLPRQ